MTNKKIDWSDTLEAFSELCKTKHYDRIEYQLWKKLAKQPDAAELMRSKANPDEIIIVWADAAHIVNKNDNSLGSYLNEVLEGRDRSIYIKADGSTIAIGKPVTETHITITKEKDTMSKMFKFDFGKVTGADGVRLSVYGVAVRNAEGTWAAYDKTAGKLMDADILNFDGTQFLYKMPVALKDIAVGDVVIHLGKPVFVVGTEGGIMVVDPVAGERKVIEPLRSPFGFDFYTKIVNLFDNFGGFNATAENPMGNMWMLMALNDGGKDMKDLLPLMMMTGANPFGGEAAGFNPMMLMLMDGGLDKDLLPLMLMGGFGTTKAAD